MVAYLLSVPVGALVIGSLLFVARRMLGTAPAATVGWVALATMASASGLLPVRFPQSKWQVPREWLRFGWVAFTALFGFMLGTGVMTAIASPGFYVLLAWGLAVSHWDSLWPVFMSFGVARALPLLIVALGVVNVENRPHRMFEWSNEMAKAAFSIQLALLAALTVMFLVSGALSA